jgi:DNA-binding MarR family transcriptional regulator
MAPYGLAPYGWRVAYHPDFATPEFLPLDRLLVRAARDLQRATERAAATEGLGVTPMGVLRVLADAGPLSHRDLAGHVGVSPATLTPMMDALEAGGALTRERGRSDRRVVYAAITPQGHERLEAASAAVEAGVSERLPRPSPRSAGLIREYLLAVIATFADEDLPGPVAGPPE